MAARRTTTAVYSGCNSLSPGMNDVWCARGRSLLCRSFAPSHPRCMHVLVRCWAVVVCRYQFTPTTTDFYEFSTCNSSSSFTEVRSCTSIGTQSHHPCDVPGMLRWPCSAAARAPPTVREWLCPLRTRACRAWASTTPAAIAAGSSSNLRRCVRIELHSRGAQSSPLLFAHHTASLSAGCVACRPQHACTLVP